MTAEFTNGDTESVSQITLLFVFFKTGSTRCNVSINAIRRSVTNVVTSSAFSARVFSTVYLFIFTGKNQVTKEKSLGCETLGKREE